EFEVEEVADNANVFFTPSKIWIIMVAAVLLIALFIYFTSVRFKKNKSVIPSEAPVVLAKNKIQLFGEFKAINNKGEDITDFFTPKVRELFLFVLINSLKSGIGASIQEINDTLWSGISSRKVANNRSVTLNKLRKI